MEQEQGEGPRGIRRVMELQLVLLFIFTTGALLWKGPAVAGAAFYGMLTALANTALLSWRLREGERKRLRIESAPERTAGPRATSPLAGAYRVSVERFVLVGVMLGVGLVVLKLAPLALTLAFVVAQLAWFALALWPGTEA